MIIETKEQFEQALKEYDAAQYFYTASPDTDVIRKAGDKVSELEAAFDNCAFINDEGGWCGP